jgi:hypothetical protein
MSPTDQSGEDGKSASSAVLGYIISSMLHDSRAVFEKIGATWIGIGLAILVLATATRQYDPFADDGASVGTATHLGSNGKFSSRRTLKGGSVCGPTARFVLVALAATGAPSTHAQASCGPQGLALSDSGDLDGAHGASATCSWALSCSDSAQGPVLSFSAFDTESNNVYVTIYDGTDGSSTELVSLHGDTAPDDVTASGADMYVFLASESEVEWSTGFTASFICQATSGGTDADPCGRGGGLGVQGGR